MNALKRILNNFITVPAGKMMKPLFFCGLFFKSILLQSFFEGANHFVPSLFGDGWRLFHGLFFGLFSLILLCSPALLLKKDRSKCVYLMIIDALTTLFCVFDACYYRAFPEMFSLSVFSLAGDAASEGFLSFKVITGLFSAWDLFFFADFILLLPAYLIRRFVHTKEPDEKKESASVRFPHQSSPKNKALAALFSRPGRFFITVALCLAVLFFIPFFHIFGAFENAYADIYNPPYLRDVAFNFTPVGYHLYDAAKTLGEAIGSTDHPLTVAPPDETTSVSPETQTAGSPFDILRDRCAASDEEWKQITDFFAFREKYAGKSDLSGAYVGKNILMLQLESLETNMLLHTVNGREITPFLNSLLKSDASSIFFSGIYDQVKSGNSSDCDYMINTGLLPTSKVFFKNYLDKAMPNIPSLLRGSGYKTVHINGSGAKCVWDYRTAYREVFGFNTDENDPDCEFFLLTAKSDEKINNYLSDEKTLAFIYDKLVSLDASQPWYVHSILCSSHMPFTGIYSLPEEQLLCPVSEELRDNKTYAYINSVHYVDEQLRIFFERAAEAGLLDNTVVMIYGDHKGLHKYYPDDAQSTVAEHPELSFIEADADPSLAVLLYDPSGKTQHREIDAYGGQVDIMPTVLDLVGIDAASCPIIMGRSLISSKIDFTVTQSGMLYTRSELASEDSRVLKRFYQTANLIVTTGFAQLFLKQ